MRHGWTTTQRSIYRNVWDEAALGWRVVAGWHFEQHIPTILAHRVSTGRSLARGHRARCG